ncbi:hypothetical protein [Photorhabdus laumondii]|uniref:hypothetical protein n=1 Tax=Photorhabdus laumondii TaxID=2218628 RepID=UPI003315C063
MANILVIGPLFFGYSQRLVELMKDDGHSVNFIVDRPSEKFLYKVLVRLSPSFLNRKCSTFFREQLSGLSDFEPDLVLVIKGEGVNKNILSMLRNKFCNAKFVNYQWDAIKSVPTFSECRNLYDKIYTFDKQDASNYSLNFRPLFFIDSLNSRESFTEQLPCIYDLSFVGTIHSDRYTIINKIKNQLPLDIHCYWYNYVTDKAMFYFRRFLNIRFLFSRMSEFQFKPLNSKDVYSIFRQSNCILDIERPQQRGLTMRTLEVLSAGKKLITTNSSIREYDLFCSGNVFVINRKNPKIPLDFLKKSPNSVDQDIIIRYSVVTWLDEVVYSNL